MINYPFLILALTLGLNLIADELGRRILDPSFSPTGGKTIKVAFFDADSTLRIAPSGSVSANGKRDVWILPEVSKEIARLNEEGYLVAIISNQGGVPRSVSLEDADGGLNFVRKMMEWLNPKAKIHYFDFAEFKDHDRKPETGMLERLEQILKDKFGEGTSIDRARSFVCGDSAYTSKQIRPDGKPGTDFSSSDREVAENFGIRFIDPAELFGWIKYGIERFQSKAEVDAFYKAHPELRKPMNNPCPFPSVVKN